MRRHGPPSAYGVELRRLRIRKGHYQSQESLSQQSDVSKVEIYNLETGGVNVPHFDTHKRLADALSLDDEERAAFDELFDELDRGRTQPGRLHLPRPHDERADGPGSQQIEQVMRLGVSALLVAGALIGLIHQLAPIARSPSAVTTLRSPLLTLTGSVVQASAVRGGHEVLLAMNLHTGTTEQLLPDLSDQQGQADSWISPAYSRARHALAAIRIDPQGVRSLWDAALTFAPDDRLSIAPHSVRELVKDCGICNTLTFSASGQQIIYETVNGLEAINLTTMTMRPLTTGADDAWPACSPNGQWIAYQHDVRYSGELLLAPSDDCTPTGPAIPVAEYALTWHPSFSPDSGLLAFNGTPGGSGPSHYRVFLVALTTSSHRGVITLPSALPMSEPGCADPTWITQNSAPHVLLVYACGAHLIAEPGELHPGWHEELGNVSALGPLLYNPTWIPPTSSPSSLPTLASAPAKTP